MTLPALVSCRRAAAPLVMVALIAPAAAQTPAGDPPRDRPGVLSAQTETVSVGVGQSEVIESPWPVTRVSITDPEVADVQVLTPTHVLLTGNAIGTTDLILWREDGRIWRAGVHVVVDLTYLGRELKKVFPDGDLSVAQSQDVLVIEGRLRRAEDVEQMHRLLDAYRIDYIDGTSVAGVQQVMLKVRVAEVSRTKIRALGVNAYYSNNGQILGLTLGPDGGAPLNPINIGVPSGSSALGNLPFSFLSDVGPVAGTTLFGAFPNSDFAFFLQALEENQYVRILAEPTLVAVSGEEATFLAGGEFPIPVVQGGVLGGGTSITIEYKEFGVRLRFRPVVLGGGSIRLHVAPEVSELSDFGAIEIQGFRVPTVLTRRTDSTLELKTGQSFIMAGLLRETTTARRSQLPVLGDLPVLGPMFRSIRHENLESELVVMVTVSLVEPSSTAVAAALPGDDYVNPTGWEFYAQGRLEGPQPHSPVSEADAAWLRELGLDGLKGPGAWATYEQSPVATRTGARQEAP